MASLATSDMVEYPMEMTPSGPGVAGVHSCQGPA